MDRKIKGSDPRGNSYARRARKIWLLSPESGFGGDGVTVPCATQRESDCTRFVDYGSMEVDRIVPGAEGGRYVRGNVRPACRKCNQADGFDTLRAVLAAKKS